MFSFPFSFLPSLDVSHMVLYSSEAMIPGTLFCDILSYVARARAGDRGYLGDLQRGLTNGQFCRSRFAHLSELLIVVRSREHRSRFRAVLILTSIVPFRFCSHYTVLKAREE